jgi:hypothetical protein
MSIHDDMQCPIPLSLSDVKSSANLPFCPVYVEFGVNNIGKEEIR